MAVTVNHWPDSKCARAFWGQQELPSYGELLTHTTQWLDPQSGERWLDLGCGCGKLTEALWRKSFGEVSVVGLDCAGVNAKAFARLGRSLSPSPREGQLRFVQGNFSSSLSIAPPGTFNGVVSGLAIQYAEHFDEQLGCWTGEAYDRVLTDVYQLLAPGGRFVFSVNVPDPRWSSIAWRGVRGLLGTSRPDRYLKRAWRMWRYGSWLSREARTGRFHYLPIGEVNSRLRQTGFIDMEHRLTYAGTAYLIRCQKPQ